MKQATIEYKEMDLAQLSPDPNNPRTIGDKAMRSLTASVRRFGLVQPIVVNKTTGHVVGGHQRIQALRKLGQKHAMVAIGEWTLAEERALNVTLNNPAVQGKFDRPDEYLGDSLQGLSLSDFRELNLESVFPKEAKEKRQVDGLSYKIVITCDDERHQSELIERLEADGLTCSPLIA